MIKSSDIISIHNRQTDSFFTISWKMTDWCNYNCPYCITGKYSQPFISQEVMEKRAEKLNKLLASKEFDKPLHLHLVGGEVTYYDLISILSKLDLTKIANIGIVSNFSQSVEYFTELGKFLDSKNIVFCLTASYHRLTISIREFGRKLVALRAACPSIRLCSDIVLSDENYEGQMGLINFLNSNMIKVNLSVERDLNNEAVPISPKVQAILDYTESTVKEYWTPVSEIVTADKKYEFTSTSQAYSNIADGGFKPQGYKCSAGVTTIRILPNGDVCRAGCAYLQQNHILGNLDVDDDIRFPVEPIVCHLDDNRFCQFCYKVNIER